MYTPECIEHISFLPAIALFDEVSEVKWRLFFNRSIHPLDGIPCLVDVQTGHPVLAYRPFVSHVKPYFAFDVRVDNPA